MFLFSGDISRDVPKSLPNLYIETFCIEDVSPEINFTEDVWPFIFWWGIEMDQWPEVG